MMPSEWQTGWLCPPLKVGRRQSGEPEELSPLSVLFPVLPSIARHQGARSASSQLHTLTSLIGGWQCAKYCAQENQMLIGKAALGSDLKMQPPPFQPWDIFVSMTFPLPPRIPQRSFIGQGSEDLYRSHEKGSLTSSLPQMENLANQHVAWSSWVSMKATCFILWHFYVGKSISIFWGQFRPHNRNISCITRSYR